MHPELCNPSILIIMVSYRYRNSHDVTFVDERAEIIKNYAVSETEEKGRTFDPCEPVAPSLASDYDVITNAMYKSLRGRVPSREVLDPCDAESFINDLI